MTSEERILLALSHKEPDRVPFDLGSTIVTGINVEAYKNLLSHLGIRNFNINVLYERSGIVEIDEEVLRKLKVDTRGLFPNSYRPAYWAKRRFEDKNYKYIVDEWGTKWKQPKENGYHYDIAESPFEEIQKIEELKDYSWPIHSESIKLKRINFRAKKLREETNRALVLESELAETFTTPFMLRGYENFYIDLIDRPKLACYLMDKMLDIQLGYWETVFENIKEYRLIVRTGDDLGSQTTTLISPDMYKKYVKPRHGKLFSSIKKFAKGDVYIFFHSDGAVYDLIPDFIDIGVDILNPVQYTASKMETKRLKKEFGKDLVFWGGGVDTQNILPSRDVETIKEEVKRRTNDLAPSGGFVFTPVHNIQYDVPAQNIIAMWEALQQYGEY